MFLCYFRRDSAERSEYTAYFCWTGDFRSRDFTEIRRDEVERRHCRGNDIET